MESQDDTNSHQQNSDPIIPPAPSEGKEEHSPTREPTANHKPNNKNISNVLMVVFTGVLAAAAIGQFIVFCFQSRVMSNQLAVMDNQLREMREGGTDTHDLAVATKTQADATKSVADNAFAQVKATNKLAREARRSADIADNSLRVGIRLFEEDRRPWIGLYFADRTDLKKMPYAPHIIGTIANSGRTPAVDVSTHVKAFFRSFFDQEPAFDNVVKGGFFINTDEVAIPPNGRKDFEVIKGYAFGDPQWEDNRVLYVLIRVNYSGTTQGSEYRTDVCLKNVMGRGFRPCFSGHDMK